MITSFLFLFNWPVSTFLTEANSLVLKGLLETHAFGLASLFLPQAHFVRWKRKQVRFECVIASNSMIRFKIIVSYMKNWAPRSYLLTQLQNGATPGCSHSTLLLRILLFSTAFRMNCVFSLHNRQLRLLSQGLPATFINISVHVYLSAFLQ